MIEVMIVTANVIEESLVDIHKIMLSMSIPAEIEAMRGQGLISTIWYE